MRVILPQRDSCHCEVKGRHLAKLLGSKFTLVFLMLQPRSYTLEDYQCSSWSCAVMQAHLATSIGFLSGTNEVGVV